MTLPKLHQPGGIVSGSLVPIISLIVDDKPSLKLQVGVGGLHSHRSLRLQELSQFTVKPTKVVNG